MKREILINATARETRVAILEDDELVELLVDRPDSRRMVGDIYLGKVDAVLPGLQAAFVDIGTEKSAFLHSSDLVFPDAGGDDDDDDAEESFHEPARNEHEQWFRVHVRILHQPTRLSMKGRRFDAPPAGRMNSNSSTRCTIEPFVAWMLGGSASFSILANRNASGQAVNA